MTGRAAPELLLAIDRRAGVLRAQLEEQLRAAVRGGQLAPGTALPSSRALARDLGVSRGVVVEAYDQLAAEGYLSTRQGAPTRVSERAFGAPAATPAPGRERPPRFDFRPGAPDVALFPRARWLASLRRALRDAPDARFDYGDPRGAPELRHALARYLGRVRGVACDPERVIVTSGMAQGMALFGRTLAGRGAHRIGVEDPWSTPGREQLASTGLVPVPVGVDARGLEVDRLVAVAPDAVVVTPAHQFPTGVVLTPDRRSALTEWAADRGAFVLEDDYDAEYRYDRQPVGSVQGLAPDRVVYAGSVSKTLAPALRLGWLVAPETLAGSIAQMKASDDLGTPVVEQLALADFLDHGELDRHLRRTRGIYRTRRDALIEALARHLPGATPAGVAAGLHLVVHLPARHDERAVLERARSRGVGLYGLSEHSMQAGKPGKDSARMPNASKPFPPALLLGYGRIAEPAIDAGIRELAKAAAG